jgi:ornithine cyclodeaminase/alanine dehydrogenase-like protein (mu-crystallin family)
MAERLGIDVRPVGTPEQAVDAADIVIVATNTGRDGDVAFRGEWLTAGQLVVSIGSTATFFREIGEVTFQRADLGGVRCPA